MLYPSLCSLIIVTTLSATILRAQDVDTTVADRFSQLDIDLKTASKDRTSIILSELCRAAKTAQKQKRACEVLGERWEETDHGTLALSLQNLAENSPDSLQPLEAKLAELLASSNDLSAVLDLIDAVRDMSSSTPELQSALKKRMLDDRYVIGIPAAVASIALDPKYELAEKKLSDFLARPEPEVIWRTASALGGIGEKSARWVEEFEKLLMHGDVRVRIAAASAIWRAKRDSKRTLPILLESLGHKNLPMPEYFVYPSNFGNSHRVFTVNVLAEMGKEAVDAIPLLTDLVKRAERDDPGNDWHEDQDSLVGLMSLVALAEIASPNGELADELEKSTSRKGSIFMVISHITVDALGKLRNGPK